jgi:prepilin-type N-terminal cleavage/methylation domain-containing protein
MSHRHTPRRPVRTATGSDAGFTMVEVVVALAMMSTVLAALTPFLINSVAVVGHQRTRQVAIQVANEAIEQMRSLRGASLLTGRGQSRSTTQWNAAPAGVQPYLATMKPAWDPTTAPAAGDEAPLPTKAQSVSVGGVTYRRSWYVGRCRQQAGTAYGTCLSPDGPDPDPEAADLPFFRVVVAVMWSHARCPGNACSYVVSTLASTATDPTFNINRPPPLVSNPGALTAYRTQAVSKPMAASGGQLPLTWDATGMPPGLSVVSSTGMITGTPTTLGTFTVTVTATDRAAASDSAGFTYTVVNPVTVTSPDDQVSRVGTAVSLPIAGSGGVSPLTFTATNLPAGLSINASSGTISGTPTTAQSTDVTVTATDSQGKAVPVALKWRVFTPVTITDPGPQTAVMHSAFTLPLTAAGGATPYSWRADDLPPGLSLNASTGQVSGSANAGTRYLTTFYAADSAGMEARVTVAIVVSAPVPTALRVTAPTTAGADRTTTAGQAVSVGATAAGGLGPGYTWTATGLPPGVSIANAGGAATISGTPTVRGTYTVRLGVKDLNAQWAYLMFTWRVQ